MCVGVARRGATHEMMNCQIVMRRGAAHHTKNVQTCKCKSHLMIKIFKKKFKKMLKKNFEIFFSKIIFVEF